MDQGTLVELQIKDGQHLIDQLAAEGVAVTAGGWVKESESGQWFLYLATPLVATDGAKRSAYRRVNTVIGELQEEGFGIDPFEVKLLGPNAPLAEAVSELHRRHAGKIPIRYGGPRLGNVSIEEAYIYPAMAATVP